MALPLLALDKFIQVVYRFHLLVQLDFNPKLILQLHQKFYRIKRVDAKLRKSAFRLYIDVYKRQA